MTFTSHWQPPLPHPEGPACKPGLLRTVTAAFALTVLRRDVDCPDCKNSPAWKGQP